MAKSTKNPTKLDILHQEIVKGIKRCEDNLESEFSQGEYSMLLNLENFIQTLNSTTLKELTKKKPDRVTPQIG